ncbi:MAG: hypothetical protein OFPI_10630 [Osedax symbiont Rs2]|nr:MAG: hypothetical protein OFPI_10630 [Osedax symbiont Rs2]
MRHVENKTDLQGQWAKSIRDRRGFNKSVVALAAKHGSILWSMLSKSTDCQLVTN